MIETTNLDSSLDEILRGLYGDADTETQPPANADEKNTSGAETETADGDPAGSEAEIGSSAGSAVEKSEADMTDEELSLAVEVDLPPETDDSGHTSASEGKTERTEEDVRKIRETAQADVLALRGAFPELRRIKSLAELPDPAGFLKYRKRGMTAEEAYQLINYGKASAESGSPIRRTQQVASSGAGAPQPRGLTSRELEDAKKFLPGLTDEEYNKYYHPIKK